jgi:hypothetical protein
MRVRSWGGEGGKRIFFLRGVDPIANAEKSLGFGVVTTVGSVAEGDFGFLGCLGRK